MVDRICRGVTTLCNEVLGGLLNNMINEIKGNNIILREQKIEAAKFFTYWYNQALAMFQCGFTEPTDEEAEKERITIGHKNKDSVWYTITDLEGNIIGETGLLRMWLVWKCTDLSVMCFFCAYFIPSGTELCIQMF